MIKKQGMLSTVWLCVWAVLFPASSSQVLRVLASGGLWRDADATDRGHKGNMKGARNASVREDDETEGVDSAKARSVMIFVSKCRR